MKFQTNECPLCGNVLHLKGGGGVMKYVCKTDSPTHYQVVASKDDMTQHFYAFPYAVENLGTTYQSKIYSWRDSKWVFRKEVHRVVAMPSDELYEHIRELVGDPATLQP